MNVPLNTKALEAAARALSEPVSAKDAASLRADWQAYLPLARIAVRAYFAALAQGGEHG
jgi:hypothetical protein